MPTGEVIDRGDGRPLAGVPVTDGLVVTRTLDDGTFSIPERPDAEFVWITVPSSHQALAEGWFARAASGARTPLRFELAPRAGRPPAGCRFVQVTDLHVSVDGGARLRPMIEAGVTTPPGLQVTGEMTGAELRADLEAIVERVRPDFVVATGDIADYGQREELAAYREAITGLDVPVASIPGNHDHLSCLTREAIEEFFDGWTKRGNPRGMSASEAFQREVFGGDWRRPGSGRMPWVDVVGPLYYSFDWGGVHFVAYDGEGRRRYGDDYPQDEWLAADLATVPAGTPVVVCTHFPEDRGFYRTRFRGVRLVASISGHWHGTRVWRDGDTLHWTSSTLGFGGTDSTPRGFRVIDVGRDGVCSRWETMETPAPPWPRVTGAAAVTGGGVVVAAFEDADASGSVRALGRWTRELPVAARGGVTAADDTVYLLDLGARLLALDAGTGETRWAAELGDPSVRWTYGVPTVADGRVYVSSPMSIHAFDAGTGAQQWRTNIARDDVAASWSGVAVDTGVIVVGGVSDHVHVAALDSATGEVCWRLSGRDIAGATATPVIAGETVLAVRAPGWLSSYAIDDGAHLWDVALDAPWPVALALAGDTALVRSSSGTVTAHKVDGGQTVWTRALDAGVRAERPYARAVGGARRPLVVGGGRVWTATFGSLVGLDLTTGEVVSETPAGSEVATVVADAGRVLAVTAAGQVVASGDA